MSKLKHPFIVVAKALGCNPESINENSEMYRDYGWDSLGHLHVLTALEINYSISIDNDTIEKYKRMSEILKLFEELKIEK